MDTSETYIKMCEKAKEIQSIVKPNHTVSPAWKDGDWFSCDNKVNCYCEYGWSGLGRDAIWLPRQDQLQEMVEFEFATDLATTFGAWIANDTLNFYIHDNFKTMEQLWLAFVMKERYSKIWNGNDWIKET